ncbi:hypothetical protein [Vulcanisaeta thermophila]|uniref:hypothetical protein n=1 Tax=Vulcanisaeta thermophila TaxID=867917 RepID=UPI001EE30703|nr:hypothetical protein [Vulcanisaeta thermophila]
MLSVTLDEIKYYYSKGYFPSGNMGPKIKAAIEFLENGGKVAYIGPLGKAKYIIKGKIGTKITIK